MFSVAWVTLSDNAYYQNFSQFFLPSWKDLPGDKFLITDNLEIKLDNFKIIDWHSVENKNALFPIKYQKSKKENNFWRKMQTQLWAIKNLKYDFIILIDADIEVVDYSSHSFDQELLKLKENSVPWAIGLKPKEDIEKFKKKTTLGPDIDSGMIVVNTAHKSIDEIFTAYEQFWETGRIHELKKAADGEVIFELIKKYPCNFLTTKMLGPGKILYEFGLFHHAGKSNKADYSSKFYPN